MRYMMLVKATKDFEAGVWPDEKMLSDPELPVSSCQWIGGASDNHE